MPLSVDLLHRHIGMHYDLHLRSKAGNEREKVRIVQRAYALGYDCICWDTSVIGKVTKSTAFPALVAIDAAFIFQSQHAIKERSLCPDKAQMSMNSFRQLRRVTVTVDEMTDALTLNLANESLHDFDIIAARPGNQRVFQYLCSTAEIDIISIDFAHRNNLSMNKKLLDEAVRRGIHFELQYAAFLHSPAIRREMLNTTQVMLQFLRGRNVIITSAADSANQLRGPFDVMNLGAVLGISEENAGRAISQNCSLVLKHAAKRRQRLLPTETISSEEFHRRFPELRFKDKLENKADETRENDYLTGHVDAQNESEDIERVECCAVNDLGENDLIDLPKSEASTFSEQTFLSFSTELRDDDDALAIDTEYASLDLRPLDTEGAYKARSPLLKTLRHKRLSRKKLRR